MKKLIAFIAGVLLATGVYAQSGPEIVRLDSLASAAYGASYVSIFDVDDFTNTNANPTVVVTSSIPAKVGLTLAGMILEEAFDDELTTRTNSVALTIGDGSDADLFLTSTELAADGTEVWVQFGRQSAGTVTPTLQTVALTNTASDANLPATVVTNLTLTYAQSSINQKYYATAGSLVYTFTCTDATYPVDFTKGKLKVYWRELK